MKILILNGSPRPEGNTAAMVGAYKAGAESAGHSVTVYNVCRMNIKGCLACEYCHTKASRAGLVPFVPGRTLQEVICHEKNLHFDGGYVIDAFGLRGRAG